MIIGMSRREASIYLMLCSIQVMYRIEVMYRKEVKGKGKNASYLVYILALKGVSLVYCFDECRFLFLFLFLPFFISF